MIGEIQVIHVDIITFKIDNFFNDTDEV